ncbi:AarF/ABC1/UbiB kinase family protein [Neobacillus sp. PS3-12]|uniref:ABC1 kinase family protein n=1 Tax=Neobacillus sp. PS3-12 TaxID=3070677 RepID=UPI0027E15CA3|nr:AarF/ABC1/UbiB kinase family protein [Neobacillus sp. PS3-12]WML52824.1 AarF/ABC1/UbiB kinase family protein [Neobacillus sp. PS3-12]
MIRKRIRHLQRYREIVNAFIRHGFGFTIKELGLSELLSFPKRLFPEGTKGSFNKSTGERIRLFLEELGPTFVKIGQVASTRYDVLPADIISELENLQDQAPPFPYENVQKIIEDELGHPIADLFKEFNEEPLAAASIGQVHYAVLKTGEPVAIKIQRPNMKGTIETDLEILQDLALLAEQRLDWAAHYQIRDIVDELAKSLLEELDYSIEGRNSEKIANQFKNDSGIVIPKVYWEYTTKKVLTMEYVEGIKLNEAEKLKEAGNNPKELAKNVVNSILKQILVEGYFHGDPHPGNVLALPGDDLVFLDFGMVGRLSSEMKNNLASLVIALMRKKTDDVVKSIMHMGIVPEDIDVMSLRADVDRLYEKYYDVALSTTSLAQVIGDLFAVAYRHHIRIPSDLTLLGKTLLTMEGMVVKLDPEISILKVAEPFGKRLLMERYEPKKVAGNVWDQLVEMGGFVNDLPKTLNEISLLLKKGKVKQEISFPDSDKIINKLNRISNRIAFSISLLSFSIVFMGLIIGSSLSGKTSTFLLKIPTVEIGFGVTVFMFLFLIYSIFKSGKF